MFIVPTRSSARLGRPNLQAPAQVRLQRLQAQARLWSLRALQQTACAAGQPAGTPHTVMPLCRLRFVYTRVCLHNGQASPALPRTSRSALRASSGCCPFEHLPPTPLKPAPQTCRTGAAQQQTHAARTPLRIALLDVAVERAHVLLELCKPQLLQCSQDVLRRDGGLLLLLAQVVGLRRHQLHELCAQGVAA